MPLPIAGQEWPPTSLAAITGKQSEFDAWYVGDPDTLRSVYAAPPRVDRPAQYRGGVTGAVARMWWGKPVGDLTAQVETDKLHVPIAADLCQASADLLFAEPPSLASSNTEAQKELDAAIEAGILGGFAEGAEVAAALGDVYFRVTWDDAFADRSFITPVHADAAVPEFRWGRLVAVTFWWIVRTEGQQVLRHLERHELDGKIGVIYHGLYEGSPTHLGHQVPLTEHPSTEGIKVDAESRLSTESDGLAVVHVPNQRPQRRWRSHPIGAHLGRSDLDGVEGHMDKLDMVYSSWMRDIRLAKSRILVPSYMLESRGSGQGAFFDTEQDVFTQLNAPPREDGKAEITAQQFDIRVEEHQRTAQQLVDNILRTAGYSRQTFGEGEDVAQTATEVTSKDRRSALTRDRKIRVMKPALTQILRKKLAVDRTLFRVSVPTDAEVSVEFVDVTQADPAVLAGTTETLFRAQAASTRTRVAMMHPDWDETAIDEEAARVLAEFSVAVPDPTGFTPAGPGAGVDSGDAGQS